MAFVKNNPRAYMPPLQIDIQESIMKHLPLGDLRTLSRTHPAFRNTAKAQMKKKPQKQIAENMLTIAKQQFRKNVPEYNKLPNYVKYLQPVADGVPLKQYIDEGGKQHASLSKQFRINRAIKLATIKLSRPEYRNIRRNNVINHNLQQANSLSRSRRGLVKEKIHGSFVRRIPKNITPLTQANVNRKQREIDFAIKSGKSKIIINALRRQQKTIMSSIKNSQQEFEKENQLRRNKEIFQKQLEKNQALQQERIQQRQQNN